MTDNPSAYGALCALKPSFPSHSLISSVSKLNTFKDAVPLIKKTLSIDSDPNGIADLEQILLLRYADMLRIAERFMNKKTAPLIRWLKGEFDLYNILLIAKNCCYCRNDETARNLLFHAPAAIEPPDPSEIQSIADLAAAYKKTCRTIDIQSAVNNLSSTEDFAVFEVSLIASRIENLSSLVIRLPKKEKEQIFRPLADMIRSVQMHIEKMMIKYPAANIRLPVTPAVSEVKSASHFKAAALTSPAARFNDCRIIRERIRLLCKAAAEKGTES